MEGASMKRWIGRTAVAAVLTGGMLAAAAAPAHAGTWVTGGIFVLKKACQTAGDKRVSTGEYQTYVCEPFGLKWRLRGFVT
jgi:hypothetical protein